MWINFIRNLLGVNMSDEIKKLLLLAIISDFVPVYHSIEEILIIYTREFQVTQYTLDIDPVKYLTNYICGSDDGSIIDKIVTFDMNAYTTQMTEKIDTPIEIKIEDVSDGSVKVKGLYVANMSIPQDNPQPATQLGTQRAMIPTARLVSRRRTQRVIPNTRVVTVKQVGTKRKIQKPVPEHSVKIGEKRKRSSELPSSSKSSKKVKNRTKVQSKKNEIDFSKNFEW
jgi:hypothetical protein